MIGIAKTYSKYHEGNLSMIQYAGFSGVIPHSAWDHPAPYDPRPQLVNTLYI